MSMSDWEIRKLDEQYGRVEDLRRARNMTCTCVNNGDYCESCQIREENARIIESHAAIKPEFVQHNGQTIADVSAAVDKVVCGDCCGYGEVAKFQDPDSSEYIMVPCPVCGAKP